MTFILSLCTDIDECIELIDDCHDESDALCMDNMGSFSCICREGFQGNGTYCEGKDHFIPQCIIINYYYRH